MNCALIYNFDFVLAKCEYELVTDFGLLKSARLSHALSSLRHPCTHSIYNGETEEKGKSAFKSNIEPQRTGEAGEKWKKVIAEIRNK